MKEVESINSTHVDQQTIDTLESLLVEAKAGNLRSLMFVDSYRDEACGSGWSGKPSMRMIGELDTLKLDFLLQALASRDSE